MKYSAKTFLLLSTLCLTLLWFIGCNNAENNHTSKLPEQPDNPPEQSVCEHQITIDAAVEPTCVEPGKSEGSHCTKCGEVLKAQEELAAKGHTEEAQ